MFFKLQENLVLEHFLPSTFLGAFQGRRTLLSPEMESP